MKVQRLFCLILVSVFLPSLSWAWGDLGHRTVAIIAENHLSETAKSKIREILGDESLEEASLWADNIKSSSSDKSFNKTRWDFLRPYHYADREQGKSYWDTPFPTVTSASGEKIDQGDAFRALVKFSELLGLERPIEKKKTALRMMIHIIGDLHQPLHQGERETKGGNTVMIAYADGFSCPKEEQVNYDNKGYNLNLHALWDHIVPNYDYFVRCQSETATGDSLEYAKCLEARYDSMSFSNSLNLDQWMTEAQNASQLAVFAGDLNAVNQEYLENAAESAGIHIYLAGIRLAAALNEQFSHGIPDDFRNFGRKMMLKYPNSDPFGFFKEDVVPEKKLRK